VLGEREKRKYQERGSVEKKELKKKHTQEQYDSFFLSAAEDRAKSARRDVVLFLWIKDFFFFF
jgi:hypothetical protein